MNLEQTITQRLVSKKLVTPDLAISKKLREAILRLSDSFTRNRADLPASYFDDETNRLAYLAGFVLTNAEKVKLCLSQVKKLLPQTGRLSVLDVGSGPGTAVFAASELLSDRDAVFTALEKNKSVLQEAKTLERALQKKHGVDWLVGGVEKTPSSPFDLIVAANVLNELDAQQQLKTVKELLSTGRLVVLIDPALKQTARDLMKLRDQLVVGSLASVIAPCTHQKPCPMLSANKRDWCHFYIEWKRPKLIEALDNATGLDHRYLKLSYLSLRARRSNLDLENKIAASPAAPRNDNYRAVSSLLKTKGKLELVVCGNGELGRLRRLDKNASETNRAFGQAKRGDLVSFQCSDSQIGPACPFSISRAPK